jgi:hypothetical protein
MSDQDFQDPRKKLKADLDEAEWAWLKPHAQRDVLIVVAPGLDLVEVGVALAEDSSEQVGKWIRQGVLGKPTAEQVNQWDTLPTKRFNCLVVQPYVLMQELLTH